MTTGARLMDEKRASKRDANVLPSVVAAMAVLPILAVLFRSSDIPPFTRVLATGLWILCLAPAFAYVSDESPTRRPIPFFPMISAVYGLYYILPIVVGAYNRYMNAEADPAFDYDLPVQLAFFGWVAMGLGYFVLGLFTRKVIKPDRVNWSARLAAHWAFAFLYGGLAITALKAWLGATIAVGGVFQFLVSLQWFGVGLLTVLARRGQLSGVQKIAFVVGFAGASVIALAGGSVAPLVMFFIVLGFALWIGRPAIGKRWVIVGIVAVLVAATFRGVAIDFRKTVWFGQEQFSTEQRFGLMIELVNKEIEDRGVTGTVLHGIEKTVQRSANMDLFADVVRRTPDRIPYWNGDTYSSLVGLAIPRFLWPDKPVKELGQAFGHRYGFLHRSNLSTSINFPFLVEFYANFGPPGVVIGMFLVGLIYRCLDGFVNRPGQSTIRSLMGVVLLLPLFLIESDFSLTFGGLPLNALALYVVWKAMNSTATERRRANVRDPVYRVGLSPAATAARLSPPALPRARQTFKRF
jgi:hypothetical protein